MKRLILFRHAKTERRAPSGDDFDRRLTEEGARDAAAMGRRLRASGYVPDLVLVSSAVRAKETWAAARSAIGEISAQEKPLLYACGPDDILRMAQGCAEEVVMVIAHNPTLHDLVVALLEAAPGADAAVGRLDGFPTASVAIFDLAGDRVRPLALMLRDDPAGTP